jgi:tellurite resistance protein
MESHAMYHQRSENFQIETARSLRPFAGVGARLRNTCGKLSDVSCSLFSIVVGLAGLGNSWRVAHSVWRLPAVVGESLFLTAASIWLVLLCFYAMKWLRNWEGAIEELQHPTDCSFISLIGISTLLIASGAIPYSRNLALVLFVTGALWAAAYAVWSTGAVWRTDRSHESITAALYLPTVAGSFVTGTVAAAVGFEGCAQLAFGAGLFSWLAIESVLMQRLYGVAPLPAFQRPGLGIQFAPPVVGAVTYLTICGNRPDIFARILIGYGLLQAFTLARLSLWILEQPFTPAYWAFTFGAASLATALLKMQLGGESGVIPEIAPYAFAAANIVIGAITLGTLKWVLFGNKESESAF